MSVGFVDDETIWPQKHELLLYGKPKPHDEQRQIGYVDTWGYINTYIGAGQTSGRKIVEMIDVRANSNNLARHEIPLLDFLREWVPVGYDRAGLLPKLAQLKLVGFRLPTAAEYGGIHVAHPETDKHVALVYTVVWITDVAALRKHFDDWKAADSIDRLSDANRNA